MEVTVLGLGYIGLPTAICLANGGNTVYGFDVNKKVVELTNQGKLHIKEEGMESELKKVVENGTFKCFDYVHQADAYILSVPSPFKKHPTYKLAELSYVESAAKLVGEVLKKGDLVILESTVPPETTQMMEDVLVKTSGLNAEDFYTAHCPERVLPGNMLYELVHNDRIIGSNRPEGALKAKELYETFVTSGEIFITDDITAEMCKLVENSFRDINIAFANELSMLCDELKIDVNELVRLANRHPRVNILSPGVGVGGHCIAVDPWFLVEKFNNKAKLIRAARETNDYKPYFVCDKILENIEYDKNKIIAIFGLAFKANIDDLRESPSIKLCHLLMDKGYNVVGVEPNVDVEEVQDIKIVSMEKALEKADLIVVTLNHKEFIENMDKIEKTNHLKY
ncbi:MAG: nucleotide sugar dehydrogenase [Erysipelotrichaceae bacterium]